MKTLTLQSANELVQQDTALGTERTPAGGARAPTTRKPLDPVHQAIVDERKASAGPGRPKSRPTRDALIELQYRKLGKLSERVIARLERALDNEDDPLHEMVVEKLMQRVVPAAFWESLAKQEFKDEDTGPKAPVFTINIGAASAPVEPVTVDVKPREVK